MSLFLFPMEFNAALGKYGAEFAILLILTLVALPSLATLYCISAWYFSSHLSRSKLTTMVAGKRCLVTGGSKGLGKEVCNLLAKSGAHVTIVARGKLVGGVNTLDDAVRSVKNFKTDEIQRISGISIDLTNQALVSEKLATAAAEHGSFDWVFCIAGQALPGFLADQITTKGSSCTDAEWGMKSNYLTALYTVQAMAGIATKPTKNSPVVGISDAILFPQRIVLVGSMLSLLSFAGFSTYSASKYALRGLADGLRNEFLPIGTKMHIYFPGNMDTPGFDDEAASKPEITHLIEGQSTLVSAKSAAEFLLASMMNERYAISNDLLGELARIATGGASPRPNMIAEVQYY